MVTTFSYSGYGDLTGTTVDAGGLNLGTIYAVDIIGDRYQTTDPRGNIFGTSHDTMRHVTGESGPLGVTHNVILRLANNLILPTKKIWPFVYEIRLMPTIGIAYSAKIIGGVW